MVFLSVDFFKYIPFRAFWFNETVWNISIISAGRGNTKTLVTNCPRCSGVEKLKLLIAKVYKAEQWYSYNCTTAYGTTNYHGSDATSWDFSRWAIDLEVSKSVQLRSTTSSWWQRDFVIELDSVSWFRLWGFRVWLRGTNSWERGLDDCVIKLRHCYYKFMLMVMCCFHFFLLSCPFYFSGELTGQ